MKYYNLSFALQKYYNFHGYLRHCFYLSALLILYTNQLQAQIVLNGNFESRSACPSAYGMVSLATGWNTPTGSTTSPDYFNTCAPIASDLNVPYRLCDTLADFIFGDSAYTGVLFRDSLTSVFVSDWYEYITTQLSHPLWPAVNYRLSFLVANKRFANFNSNIGAIITRNVPSQAGRHPIPYPPLPTHQPSFNSDTEITSKTWQWLNFNFRTDTCDLHYLTIGRFYQDTLAIDTNPRPRPAICAGREHYCYYFIDGISIIGNEPSTALPNSIALCDSAKIAVDTGYFVGFQWYRNDTLLLGATRYNYYATIPGRYYVRLTLPICNSYVFSDTEIVYRPRDRMHLDFKSTSCSKSTLKVSFDGGITPIVVWNCPIATQPIDTNYSYSPRFLRYDTLNLVQLHIDYGSGCTFDTLLYIYPCCGTANTTGIDSLGVNRASLLLNYYDLNHDGRLTGMELGMAYNQDGYLNIDTNITFDSVEIQMQVDAGIIINASRTLIIKNSFLHACSNRMWNGIYVMDSTKSLYLTNNKIADAKEAVHTEQNGKIVVKDNIFDVNYKSIVIQNYWGTYKDTISHNQFLCQSITSYIPYTTLLAPYVGQRSYLGIAVNNVKSVNIGELGSTATRNKFDNLYNGIATFMSGGNIRNNEMISINNSTLDGKGISVKGDNSFNAFNLSMELGFDIANQNKLTNCNYGVELQGMAAEILYNDFNNNFQAIRFINTNSALLGGLKFNTRIHHNSIDTLKGTLTFDALGINTDQVYNSIKLIDNNTITNPSFSSSTDLMTKSVGILSNNSLSAGSGNYEANNNTITNIRLGIKIYNGDSMHIHNNTISNAMTYPTLNKVGINLTNTVKSRVDCNTITMRFAIGTQDMCIGLQASPNNRVRKNMLNNGNMAIRFNGDCRSNDNVWGNIMNQFNYFIVRSNGGQIGKQSQAGSDVTKLPGNKFSGSSPRLYSMISSTDTVQTFRYNSTGSYFAYSTPSSLSTIDGFPSRVIPVISTTLLPPFMWAETPASCGTLPYLVEEDDTTGVDSSDIEMAMMIAGTDLSGTDEEVTQQYEAKDFLYADMQTDSAKYGWNSTLSDFKEEYEGSDAYELKQAEKQLSTLDTATADETLESTSTTIDAMENMKTILNLQLDTTPIDTGTEKFELVESIAYSCPYTKGKAVYYARAMLISHYGYIEFDDDALCNISDETSHFRRADPNGTKEKTEIEIVPNPVINVFTIKNNTGKEVRSIDIYDMAGRHMSTVKSTNIDMSKYSSGRYLVRVRYIDDSETSTLFMKEE